MDNRFLLNTTAVVLKTSVGDINENKRQILKAIQSADPRSEVLLFPELCLTGYTCFDLFQSQDFVNQALSATLEIAEAIEPSLVVLVGLPLIHEDKLYNVAAVLNNHKVLAFIPKTYLPSTHEYYEKRWFDSSFTIGKDTIEVRGEAIPIRTDVLFAFDNGVTFGVEVCEDLWVPIPPSTYHCLAGASLIFNLSASNELIAKAQYREDLVRVHSSTSVCGYLYVSSGYSESTTDTLFSGHAIAGCYGSLLKAEKLGEEGSMSVVFDLENCLNQRRSQTSYRDSITRFHQDQKRDYLIIPLFIKKQDLSDLLVVDPYPFVPHDALAREARCKEILEIQSEGLKQRLEKTGIQKAMIGVSGGLDSTLALAVTALAFDKMKRPRNNIVAVTMPGFGTSEHTLHNAKALMSYFQTDARVIDIKASCIQHMKDIGQDPQTYDVTFENIQARERTKILMDLANKENGLVIGTGNLSESALGWSTYNGDHMSMYAVNIGIPKTLIKYLVDAYAKLPGTSKETREVLLSVLATPISPELLPTKDGEIVQKTEVSIGKYDLHDFFLYYFVHHQYGFAKILDLAKIAFRGMIEEKEIRDTLTIFIKRFFTQQFKRSCMPDGIKVGSVSLSPRTDWRMPSDASYKTYLKQIEEQ